MTGRRVTTLAVMYAVLGVLPLFLVSAQSVQLQRDLDFDKAGLGLAVSLCFAASALTATGAGRLIERVGPTTGLRLSASLSLCGLLVMAIVASTWWHVAVAVALSGVANAVAQVSTNVALARGVPKRRQGIAFGAKQAAIPTASLAAGLALPLVGLVAGWRWAFAGAAVVVAVAVLRVPRLEGGAAPRLSSAESDCGTPRPDPGHDHHAATSGKAAAGREGAASRQAATGAAAAAGHEGAASRPAATGAAAAAGHEGAASRQAATGAAAAAGHEGAASRQAATGAAAAAGHEGAASRQAATGAAAAAGHEGAASRQAAVSDEAARSREAPAGRRAGVRTPLLVLLATAGLLAGAVGNAIPTFTVDSSVARGIDESLAGLLLAAGSLASITGRIGSGWVADRRGSAGISELASLTAIGSLACATLALSSGSDALFAVAVVVSFGAGWGWAGVIYFAVVRTHPQAPAAATAFVLSVVFVGNVIGPAGVGFIAQHGSYELAWGVGAAVLALATAAALAARQASRPVAS